LLQNEIILTILMSTLFSPWPLSFASEETIFSPYQISMEFEKSGARKFFKDHPIGKGPYWTTIKKKIESGNEEWLNLAKIIRMESDAGVSELLDNSLAYAIKVNAIGVLNVIKEINQSVCGEMRFDAVENPNPRGDLKELNARMNSIKLIKRELLTENLEKIKRKCVEDIKNRMDSIKKAK
jgi:hypothetical protein